MNLTGIVSVTGKPGLYKVIGQNKSGFILETLDEAKNKLLINPNTRIAALKEITIFGLEDDIRLEDIFTAMKAQAAELPVPAPKSDNSTLREYFEKISPDHDSERVYVSDIKKIVSWYGILSELPLFEEEEQEAPGEDADEQKGPEEQDAQKEPTGKKEPETKGSAAKKKPAGKKEPEGQGKEKAPGNKEKK